MRPIIRATGIIAAAVVAFAAALPVCVYVASEAVIERRYPLPAGGEAAAAEETMIRRGAHLAQIAGCADCHGANFEGRPLNTPPGWHLWSSNLRVAATKFSVSEFDQALRRGIAPDATSLWQMPSASYLYMGESDADALLGYLRSLGPSGPLRPRPAWNLRQRAQLLEGKIAPSAVAVRDAPNSLDPGPRYDGGRYLARIACSECHGTDLAGGSGVPDLNVVSSYDRPQFFDILRRGTGARGRRAPVMKRLSKTRYRNLADYEIIALYDYLEARAHAPAALVARARAIEMRRRARSAVEEQE